MNQSLTKHIARRWLHAYTKHAFVVSFLQHHLAARTVPSIEQQYFTTFMATISCIPDKVFRTFLPFWIIRIFYGCEVRIEKSVLGSLFGITKLCRVMPNSDSEGRSFLSTSNNHDRFFFLHIFWSPTGTINELRSYTLTSAILKVDVICDVAKTSAPKALTTVLRDTCCNSFFIYPTGRIRVCKTRFDSTGDNRGKPCLVCKKFPSYQGVQVDRVHDVRTC